MNEIIRHRLESQIAELISLLIMHDEIKNPGLSKFVSIHSVKISPDSAHANISVSSFESVEQLDRSVAALNSAAGFIQKKLSRRLKTRNTPHLIFHKDTSIRDGMEVNRLIDSLQETDE